MNKSNNNYVLRILAYVLTSPRYSLLDKIIYIILAFSLVSGIGYVFFSFFTLVIFRSNNILLYVLPVGILIILLVISKSMNSFIQQKYTRHFYLDVLGRDLTLKVKRETDYLLKGPVKQFWQMSIGLNTANLKSAFIGLFCIILFMSILIFLKISSNYFIVIGTILFIVWIAFSLRSYQSWYNKEMKPFLSTINNPPVKSARWAADFKNGIYFFAIIGIVYVVVLTLVKIYIFRYKSL